MNILNVCTKNEIELIENAGFKVENKDYTKDELRRCEAQITDYIMSHSTKNGDIGNLSREYSNIFNIFGIK